MPIMKELFCMSRNAFPDLKILENEPLSKHTSFRIGGPAAVMAFPTSVEELAFLIKTSKMLDIKTAILGAGTNVLAPDEGLDHLVVCLKDCLGGIELLGADTLRVGAGVTMTRAAVYAAGKGLSGLEFAHGIPGTVGGGVYMNAGAYGSEICQVCRQVQVINTDGELHSLTAEEMQFSYRHSILEKTGDIVVSAVLLLTPDREDNIRAKMQELMKKRSASQPLDLPSAGSAFKRPSNGYAAALIDQAGLRGKRVGGAAVSEKHAGFIVNLGGATAADVRSLLQEVSDIVFDRSGVRLQPEVRIW